MLTATRQDEANAREMVKRKQQEQDIIEVWEYKSSSDLYNSVYLGSMRIATACDKLGFEYGHQLSVEDMLAKATDKQVTDCWMCLRYYIRFMRKYPAKKCPHCGQIMMRQE